VDYDLCIAADTQGGGHLVTTALAELQDRQAAHKHPTAAASAHHVHTHNVSQTAGVSDVAELEYKAWKDMPHQPQLEALMGHGASASSRWVVFAASIANASSTQRLGHLGSMESHNDTCPESLGAHKLVPGYHICDAAANTSSMSVHAGVGCACAETPSLTIAN
jgi:hypothetical protein